jgi:hypothetical protein
MGSSEAGTLSWYYSANNNIEENVPVTAYPYARSEYYEDGTGDAKRASGVGETLKLGSGHEVLSGTFPVFNELTHYYGTRENALSGVTQNAPTVDAGVQTVTRDQNGRYAIAITDKNGKNVLMARKGTSNLHSLAIHNIVTSQVVNDSQSNYRPSTYFYLLEEQLVSITSFGAQYVIEDVLAATIYDPSGDGDPEWDAGFYRILLATGTISLEFTNYFDDVSYRFYDDAGRLKTSISPNGIKQLLRVPQPPISDVDQTTTSYNHRGWIMSVKEPDAGTTRYLYRRDGNIRFSQNAAQNINDNEGERVAGKGKFSYTHYDYLSRPVESGEYIGIAHTFLSVKTQLEFQDQVVFTNDTKDWVRTYYDFPVNEDNDALNDMPAGLPSDLTQEYMRGAVSASANANNQTWYSYDEFGRVTWMVQKPKRLNRVFVTRYSYDYVGNILTVQNASYTVGSSVALDAFYHHYEYNKDNRLYKAYTSVDGTNKKLRATYEYYLHGPLKRIELGEKLQGIDFVYNIHGWLTQINHPDNVQDPGNDGVSTGVRPDVFGMVLDYYKSDLNNLYTASTFSPERMKDLHGLPIKDMPVYASNHQPLIRFTDFYNYDPASDVINLKEHSAENPKYQSMLSELNSAR